MTTTHDDFDEQQQANESSVITQLRKQLREAQRGAADNAEAAARAEAAERELAFLRAGVDPTKPGANWFIKGYDGDLGTDAVRKAAGEAGLLVGTSSAGAAQQVEPHQAVARTMGQIDAATAGAFGGVSPVNHLENMQRALQRGGIEAMADYMRSAGLPVTGDDQ